LGECNDPALQVDYGDEKTDYNDTIIPSPVSSPVKGEGIEGMFFHQGRGEKEARGLPRVIMHPGSTGLHTNICDCPKRMRWCKGCGITQGKPASCLPTNWGGS